MLHLDEIGICCFSAKHTSLWKKSKDWLTQKQDNVSEWNNMSTHDKFDIGITQTQSFNKCMQQDMCRS
jgi:uncharacterized protein YjiS (DUF1127 family)